MCLNNYLHSGNENKEAKYRDYPVPFRRPLLGVAPTEIVNLTLTSYAEIREAAFV